MNSPCQWWSASNAFRSAMADLNSSSAYDTWRRDYGTMLRDNAAVLTLAAETRTSGDQDEIAITLELPVEAENASIKVHVNGEPVAMQRSGAVVRLSIVRTARGAGPGSGAR